MFQEGKGCLNVNKFDITITIKDKKRVLKIDLWFNNSFAEQVNFFFLPMCAGSSNE